jgi:hypothetical protein
MLRPRVVHFVSGAFILGLVSTWLLPDEWFGYFLASGIAAAILFGILANFQTHEPHLSPPGVKALSYVLIGTDSPTTIVEPGLALWIFFVLAAYVIGMLANVFWLAW